jgi:hypothetical protein
VKHLAVLAAVLFALVCSTRAEARPMVPIPEVVCGIICDPGGGWRYCNQTANGVWAYDNLTGWWRCGYGYAPGPAPYTPQLGFLSSCPGGWPYWGWCWFWRTT